MADDDRRLEKNNEVGRNTDVEDGNKKNQACKVAQVATAEAQEDTGVAREGEETLNLDLGDRGDNKVTREGEETSKLDRGDEEATREGEETPKLDLRDHEDIEATRCITPVITKEEEIPGREGDTREDEGSRNTYHTAPCLRYQAEKEKEEARNQAKTGMAPTVTRLDIGEKYQAKKAPPVTRYQTGHCLQYQAEKEEEEAKYQSALCLQYQDEDEEEEAKHQTTLSCQYQAKNEEEEPNYRAGELLGRPPSTGTTRQRTRCPRTGWRSS